MAQPSTAYRVLDNHARALATQVHQLIDLRAYYYRGCSQDQTPRGTHGCTCEDIRQGLSNTIEALRSAILALEEHS